MEGNPAKKRRFFKNESEFMNNVVFQNLNEASSKASNTPGPQTSELTTNSFPTPSTSPSLGLSPSSATSANNETEAFGIEMLEKIIEEKVSNEVLLALRELSGGDLSSAINYYFDGTLKKFLSARKSNNNTIKPEPSNFSSNLNLRQSTVSQRPDNNDSHDKPQPARLNETRRYIGSFTIEAWAIRSGTGMLNYKDKVFIKRQERKKVVFGQKVISKAEDIIVKLTDKQGREVARLPQDKATFVSSLLDLQICEFAGSVVFADYKISAGDNILVSLECYIKLSAFDNNQGDKNVSDNRKLIFLQTKETEDEKQLRLRQVALVRLFLEVGLKPFKASDAVKIDHARGRLEMAAMAEQFDVKVGSANGLKSAVGDNKSDEEETEEKDLEQGQLDALYKKAQMYDIDMEQAEPAETFNMNLHVYQKQGLRWMLAKENLNDDQIKGTPDLMHPLWEEYKWPIAPDDQDVKRGDSFYLNPYSGELSLKFPRMQKTSLGGILADEMGLGKTISTMALIHSSKHGPANSSVPSSGKPFASNTTLVVAPMSLLSQWESEATQASKPGSCNVIVYYGQRNVNFHDFVTDSKHMTVIITSYGTVVSDFGRRKAGDRTGTTLYDVQFLRIVLDEAHTIRTRTTHISKACCELLSERKWALTGTPIVNRLEDLYSLVRFLRIEPWSHFQFWRTFITIPFESKDFLQALDVVQTVLEPIILRRTKNMKDKNGEPLVSLPPKKVITETINLTETERQVYDLFYRMAKATFNRNLANGTVLKSYTTILSQILRLRQSCCHPSLVQTAVRGDELENGGEDSSTKLTDGNGNQGLLDNEDEVDLEQLLAKFNQTEEESSVTDTYGIEVAQQIVQETDQECPICSSEPIIDPVVSSCWHMSCLKCLIEHIDFQEQRNQTPRCHSCRKEISKNDIFEVIAHVTDGNDTKEYSLRRYKPQSSAKISHLMTKLQAIRQEEPNTKSVVFSQFTGFLNKIEESLSRHKYRYLRFDGQMTKKQREHVLQEFQTQPKYTVLLISLKSGGVGLNLVSASKVFMMDPWWSFAVEAQAIDRVHRMGQTQTVTVYRLIVEGSVEERMLKIQDRKQFLASSLGMSEQERKNKRIEDIKLLFG
ncbi:SNF2 family N-terminal domain-containing protein [Lipomyces japonicus]|uniref:SNF2 family N-terminal domain-containing protein n=1 Tax=Lipomyces japonicus TaxID=56871 RepID=UPI0034CE07FF